MTHINSAKKDTNNINKYAIDTPTLRNDTNHGETRHREPIKCTCKEKSPT